MDQRISVYGLGKLGCTMMACFAHKGWDVVGVDVIEKVVDNINNSYCPIYEPGVAELIRDNKSRISATTDLVKAAIDTDVSFIIVPTPSRKDGSFTVEYVESAIKSIGLALREKDTYHLVIVTSTVMPGDTQRMADTLEDISGKTCGVDFGVCYNPDFIALGKIVKDFLNPDMILIGESDPQAGSCLEVIHRKLVNNSPEFHRMSFSNAELAKIGLNSYCVMKIGFANVIGEICEKMPTGDAEKVLEAIGSDSRVGKKYFKAGLAAAGPCLKPLALVQTSEGLKPICTIKVEDRVLTHKGRYRKVTETFERSYNGPMVKITSKGPNSKPITATPDHPIWVSKKSKEGFSDPDFIDACSVTTIDALLIPTLNLDTSETAIINLDLLNPQAEGLITQSSAASGYEIKEVSDDYYNGFVYNIEVEEDNSYVLEWGTVHNCFPRDNRAFKNLSRSLDIHNTFAVVSDTINNYHKYTRVPDLLRSILEEKQTSKLAVLGVAYKEDINIIEESASIEVVKQMSKAGATIRIYDPACREAARKELAAFSNISFHESITECLEGSEVCFIGTPWKEFKTISAEVFSKCLGEKATILDSWGIYKNSEIESSDLIDYKRIGALNSSLAYLIPLLTNETPNE